jgi:hypothetical protein
MYDPFNTRLFYLIHFQIILSVSLFCNFKHHENNHLKIPPGNIFHKQEFGEESFFLQSQNNNKSIDLYKSVTTKEAMS